MKLLPLDQIEVPTNRVRKVFDEKGHTELVASIRDFGLFHLPIVRGNMLVSGERRLRACKALHTEPESAGLMYGGQPQPAGMMPVLDWDELDDETAMEVEIQENTIRTDIPWQEVASARRALLALRQSRNPEYSYPDLAAEVGTSRSTDVKEQVILADNFDIPAVRNAATLKDAKKALYRHQEAELKGLLGVTVDSAATPHTLRQTDAATLLAEVPPFDVLITDPPYGQDAGTIRASMKIDHTYEDGREATLDMLGTVAQDAYAAARPQAHAYVFCNILLFPDLVQRFTAAGWQVWPRPLIWVKDVGHTPAANFGPSYNYEAVLFANKGEKPTQFLAPSAFSVPAVKKEGKEHAAQKPVGVYTNLLARSCVPGDLIIDPFCGSGTCFPAANALQLTAWGGDIDEASVDTARTRLAEVPT